MKKSKSEKDNILDIFKKITFGDLQNFLTNQIKRDANLQNAFFTHFAELLDQEPDDKYRTIVAGIFKSSYVNDSYFGYYDESELTSQLFELLQKAEGFLSKKNVLESLSICKIIIEEIPSVINEIQESDGQSELLLVNAFKLFQNILDHAPVILKDELFIYCINEYPKQKYHQIECEEEFLDSLLELISTKDQEIQFFDLIDKQISNETLTNKYPYGIVSLIKIKINYLQRKKRILEIQELLEANKQYSEIRMLLVDQAVSKHEFQLAKDLSLEGIVIAKKEGFAGTEKHWIEKLLEIAELNTDKADIKKWAYELYMKFTNKIEYFKKIKASYPNEEWPEKCEEIINTLKGTNQRTGYEEAEAIAKIFIEENYLDRLLKLLQLNKDKYLFVIKYISHIQSKFPAESLELYEVGLEEYATQTGRNIYEEIAKILKKMKKIKGGHEKIKDIIAYFRKAYPNRRAMMEILNIEFPETKELPNAKELLKTKEVHKGLDKNSPGLFD